MKNRFEPLTARGSPSSSGHTPSFFGAGQWSCFKFPIATVPSTFDAPLQRQSADSGQGDTSWFRKGSSCAQSLSCP